MQGFGEVLRAARIEKNVELEIVSRDTNIALRYLEALETEKLTLFPGEPYLLGFLRNYAEYLELDPVELTELYRRIKIQQSATPEKLIAPKKKFPIIPVILLILVVGGGVALFTWLGLMQSERRLEAERAAAVASEPAVYTLTDEPLQVTLHKGDTLIIPGNDGDTELAVLNTLSFLSLQTPIGVQIVDQGEELGLDIDGTPGSELSVYVVGISKKDASKGAEVRLLANSAVVKAAPVTDQVITGAAAGAVRRLTVFEGVTAFPFTMNATFRGACLFRYQSDRQTPVEDLYSNGDVLVAQANNGIRVWLSNANAVKIQVIAGGKTVDMEIGRPGQVLVHDIKWIKDEDGRYRLIVFDVE